MNAKVTNTKVNVPNSNKISSPDRVQIIDSTTDAADCVQQHRIIAAVDKPVGEVLSPTTVSADLGSPSYEQQLPSSQLPIVSAISTNMPSDESQSMSDLSVYDYVVHVEKSTDSEGLLVHARKLVNGAYELIFDGAINAFMGDAVVSTNVLTRVTEVLEHVKATVTNEEVPCAEQATQPVEKEVDAEVSRGFCLSIPDFADLLISHNGDVVLDGNNIKAQGASIHISSTENVIVNNANLAGLSVAARSLLLDGQEDIRSIKFTSNLYSENSLHSLLIGEHCELMAQEISLTDATLVNLGKLHIEKRLSLDNHFESTAGNVFNIGSIETTDSALLDGIGYLFNDQSGRITSRTGINLSSVSLSNLGKIESDIINITTAKLLSNSGEIQSKKSLLLNSLEDAVNDGEINGGAGRVDILGNQFLNTREARLSAARVSLHTSNSELRGEMFGQEGFFLGDVKNYGAVNFQRGVLSKHFINFAPSITFAARTELEGDAVVFENSGKLVTNELISNAKIGEMVGGRTTATSIKVNENKNLIFKSIAQDIKTVNIERSSVFSAENGSDLSSLERINNSGAATFNTHLLQLVNVVNKPKAELHFLKHVKLSARKATVDEESFLKNIEHEAKQNSEGVVVDDDQGEVGVKDDRSLRDMIGLYNEGSIFVRGGGEEISDNVLDTSKSGDTTRQGYNFDLEGTYIGAKDSILQLAGGARVIADDYANNGTISSSGKLEVNQHRDVRKFGDVASKENITYNIHGAILNLSSWFINPTIAGLEKVFRICAEHAEVYATRDFNADVNMEISAKNIEVFSKLTSNSLKLNLKEKFHNTHGTLSAKEFIHLNANSFLNESGTLKCLKEMIIKIKEMFKNTGGLRIEKDMLEQLTVYKTAPVAQEEIQKQADNCWKNCEGKIFNAGFIRSRHAVMTHYGEMAVVKSDNNNLGSIIVEQAVRDVNSKKRNGPCNDNDPIAFVKLDKYSETVIHDVYHVESAKIGAVTCDGKMKITAGVFDNSFGVISAKDGMSIESRQAVINECGMIHSGGETTINGGNLRNGYLKGQKEFISCDPKQPVSVGSSINIWVEPRKVTVDKKNGHNEILATINTNIIVDYEKIPVYSTESRYPGFIFSEDKLQINTELEGHLGTIVSGQDIYLKGEKFSELNFKYQGHVVACGNVNAEMKTAQLEQFSMAAENIQTKIISALAKLTLGEMKTGLLSKDGQQVSTYQTRSFMNRSNSDTNIMLASLDNLLGSARRNTEIDMSGFPAAKKSAQFCMQADTMKKLKRILVSILLPKVGDGTGEQSTNIEPTTTNQSNMLSSVHQYNPWLLNELIALLPNGVHAMKKALIHSAGDVQINPGDTGIESKDMTIISDKHAEISSEYKYSGKFARTGVNPVNLGVTGTLEVSGKEGVEVNAANLHGNTVQLSSESGNVVFNEMRLDPQTTVVDRNTYVVKQTSVIATVSADNKIEISAPNGVVDQRGTVMVSWEGGVVVQAKEHIMQPVVDTARAVRAQGRTYSEVVVSENKLPKIITNGTVVLDSSDTTLIGAEIVAKKVLNNITGNCTVMPAIDTRDAYSKTSSKKKAFGFTISKSTMEVREHAEYANQPRIIAEEFKSLGAGKLVLKDVFVKTLSSEIQKTLIEKNAHVHNSSKITKKSSGLFVPKLKVDPLVSSLNGLSDVASGSLGDVVPAAMNVIGNIAQTWAHAITLKNIALNDHPVLAIANIIFSRNTSCALYSRMTQTTTREETIPMQSHIETGVLTISNDRTHLEGKWEVGTAKIETGELTTSSDKHVVEQKTEQKGLSISLSPAAIAMACLAPVGGTAATIISCLPSVGSQKGTANGRSEEIVPMTFTANELFIKCNDAVFSGSTIRAKMVEAVVAGNLKIETLTDLFKSHSKSSAINVSLSSIFGAIKGKDAVDVSKSLSTSDLAAVPGFRMANTQELDKRIDECAQFVGIEQFYLKVGETLYNKGAQIGLMKPDGHVVNGENQNEKIEAGRVVEESVKEEHYKKSHVFNPSINEFATMMGNIDDLKRVRAQVAALKAHQKASAAEIAQADKDIKEFFEQPDVKDSYEKLNEAKHKLNESTDKVIELEASRAEINNIQANSDSQPQQIIANTAAQQEYTAAVDEQHNIARECFKLVNVIREKSEEFAKNHPNWAKVGVYALEGAGLIGVAGIIKAGMKFGGARAVAYFGSQFLSQELVASMMEKGTEALVDYAVSQATNETEAVEFAQTAVWSIEMLLNGANIVGVAGVIKDSGALSRKLSTTKCNIGAAAKAQFKNKESVRKLSSEKITAIAEERAAAIAKQRAVGNVGTYKELTSNKPQGGFQDGKQAHHIPSKAFMEKYGIAENDGLAIMMTKEQHYKTRTFGPAPTDNNPRSELAKDLRDVREILRNDGDYTSEVNKNLLDQVKQHKENLPEIFKKDGQK